MPQTKPTPASEELVFPRGIPTAPIAPANYRIFVIINHCTLLGLAVHTLLIPTFVAMDVSVMALFNVISSLLWGAAFLLNRRGHHTPAMLAMLVEGFAHATMATLYVGWHGGFQYYLFLAAPLFYFTPLLDELAKFLVALAAVLLYIGLHAYADSFAPFYQLPHEQLDVLSYFNIATAFIVLSALSHYYHRIATEAELALQQNNAQLETLAGTDSLTGLLNRRRLLQQFESEVYRMRRTQRPLTAVLGDLDDFKEINDRHGHHVGDRVLTTVARLASDAIRGHDLLARWGGEEFLLLLPDTDLAGAAAVAEKLRIAVMETPFRIDADTSISATASFGVAELPHEEGHEKFDYSRLVNAADAALYAAKKGGRNRTMMA